MKIRTRIHDTLVAVSQNKTFMVLAISGIVIMILDSTLGVYCTPRVSRIIDISNNEVFLIYSIIFTIIAFVILLRVGQLISFKSNPNKYLYGIIFASQILLSALYFYIYFQMVTSSIYYSSIVSFAIYVSLSISAFFLLISSIKFLRWFAIGKSYLVLLYGLVMCSLLANGIFGVLYYQQIALSHNDVIKRTSCRAIMASLYNLNPEITYDLKRLYDITSILSFVLAWSATVIILKQHRGRFNKLRYWILVCLPLVFFMYRYEVALYYVLNDQASDLFASIKLDSDLFGSKALEVFLNSNLQFGGAFFALAFMAAATKLSKFAELKNWLIMTGVGMLFLFASKDIGALFYASYPPAGLISASFISIASYLAYLGIYNAAKLTSRNSLFREHVRRRVEKDFALLKNIGLSEDRIETEIRVKELMSLSDQWENQTDHENMSKEEVMELVNDVVSEFRRKSRSPE